MNKRGIIGLVAGAGAVSGGIAVPTTYFIGQVEKENIIRQTTAKRLEQVEIENKDLKDKNKDNEQTLNNAKKMLDDIEIQIAQLQEKIKFVHRPGEFNCGWNRVYRPEGFEQTYVLFNKTYTLKFDISKCVANGS